MFLRRMDLSVNWEIPLGGLAEVGTPGLLRERGAARCGHELRCFDRDCAGGLAAFLLSRTGNVSLDETVWTTRVSVIAGKCGGDQDARSQSRVV